MSAGLWWQKFAPLPHTYIAWQVSDRINLEGENVHLHKVNNYMIKGGEIEINGQEHWA